MGYLPHLTNPELADSPSARYYHDLIAQSAEARSRGDHWAAQRLASEAHKWAMAELVRLQRVAHAQESLAEATRQLEAVWDKDRDCATIAELRERHPEFRRTIANWDAARQRLHALETPAASGGAATPAAGPD